MPHMCTRRQSCRGAAVTPKNNQGARGRIPAPSSNPRAAGREGSWKAAVFLVRVAFIFSLEVREETPPVKRKLSETERGKTKRAALKRHSSPSQQGTSVCLEKTSKQQKRVRATHASCCSLG